jgi:hypothetical protein
MVFCFPVADMEEAGREMVVQKLPATSLIQCVNVII